VSYLLGIDVGTARTSAAVVRLPADDVETVDLGDGDGVASVLHIGADGTLHVGEVAEEWARTEPERVVGGFAQRIGDASPPMLLAGEPWAPEELTAWLARWVVDRVAEREGGPASEIAVTHPTAWDDERTRLLDDALAEQDLDVTFVAVAQAVVLEHAGEPGSAIAVHDVGSGDVSVLRVAFDGGLPEVLGFEAGVDLEHGAAALDDVVGAAGLTPADLSAVLLTGGSGTALAAEAVPQQAVTVARDSAARGAARSLATVSDREGDAARPYGFTGGTLNTAGLLSGYTPAGGTAVAWSDEPPTDLVPTDVVAADPPTRLAPAGTARSAAARPRRDPAVLVGLGGVTAAVAVVGTVFLWPAPRTTNSAETRALAPAAPVVTAVEPAPTTSLPVTTSLEAAPTRRPRPEAPVRTRRTVVEPTPVPVAETTVPPSITPEPTAPTTTSAPPESTAPPPTEPSETVEPTSVD
jgi:hypothetical protein